MRCMTGNRERNVQRQFDIDSFLQPLVDDLRLLAVDGVPAKRWTTLGQGGPEVLVDFTLRAHLLTFTGDMPAVSKVSSDGSYRVHML
jgi:hypothetical protein